MWSVIYNQRCREWHEKSCPRVVDGDGQTVVYPPVFVGHPGMYDAEADAICQNIVAGERALEAFQVMITASPLAWSDA